ncbi:penicillin-binding protein activator LpoB [Leptospira selangorensis]|uniref:penicillin-binding protein activator LpoB n=1 Tax=Leptospira selangorensis TaxID=2484982 RepID=UPI0010841133|nr:penicillin-binding protein activator LpoB [Leptospira selangorensis]TGK02123.1 penicillin-binding protein activator LpoB [Leptospira selangorensis]
MKFYLLPIFIILSFYYCASVEYRDPSQIEGTKQWGVREVRETVQNMSISLSDFYKKDSVKGYIELQKFKNNTSEHIDTKILANEIVTNLTSNKIPFVDTSQRKASLDEISLNKSGITTSDTKLDFGKLKSPSYRLSGELNDLVNYEKGKKIQYILITLRLTSVESNEIVWQTDKKFLKISDTEGYGL